MSVTSGPQKVNLIFPIF